MNSIRRPGGEDSVEMECREEMTSKYLVLTNEAERAGHSREGTSMHLGSREGMEDILWETMILGMWLLIWGCPNSQPVVTISIQCLAAILNCYITWCRENSPWHDGQRSIRNLLRT